MNFYARSYNLYLLLLITLLINGCGTFSHDKKKSDVGAIRIHLEAPVSVPDQTQDVSLINHSVSLTIDEDPTLTEINLLAATLVETPGGFAVRIKFDETGSWMLEQATAGNPGKHLVIFGQWGDKISEGRWLAAPVITHRIADGVLTFTPDATREEAERWVAGLKHTSKLINLPNQK